MPGLPWIYPKQMIEEEIPKSPSRPFFVRIEHFPEPNLQEFITPKRKSRSDKLIFVHKLDQVEEEKSILFMPEVNISKDIDEFDRNLISQGKKDTLIFIKSLPL